MVELTRVPIADRVKDLIESILTKHGATLVETEDPIPLGAREPTRMYKLTFPAGTRRENRLVMMRSVPFEMYFPDGWRMRGAELWPLERLEGDTCINVIYYQEEDIITPP